MAGELGVILKVVEPVKTFLFDSIRDYVGYIGSCEDNLCTLRRTLSDVCDKKDDITKKVKEGEDKLEEITREAASWLKDVRLLAGDEELKSLMYKDVETAKFMVRLIGKKDLKKLVRKDGEMQKLVVNVMNELKEEMEQCEEEMREIAKVDYKMVAEVVVEVMKDTTEEFKKLVKKDKKMAVMATKMLKNRDLDKLTKDDKEMEEIVREAGNISDDDLGQNDGAEVEEESNGALVKVPEVAVDQNTVREAATKLLTPLGNLLTPLGKLMDDANFKNAVPEAEGVKLGLDVIEGLLLKSWGLKRRDENTRQHSSCFCCAFDLSHFRNRYKMSIAAETMAKHIEDDLLKKCPGHPVTVRIRSVDMKHIPTQFLKGLESRDRLLQKILKILREDQVDAVGVYGMGGCGKTTLAKEVASKFVDDTFDTKVMVEISESPDIGRIQGTIAESVGLPLQDVQNIAQRATMLYTRLTKEKKILIILDNIWEKLNLDDVGIPRTCKLLLTTREKEVCRLMGVKDANTLELGLLDAVEAKGLFRSQAGDKVDKEEYKAVIDRLLIKCGGLPLTIVVTATALKDKYLPSWQKFADDLEKPISSQLTSSDHRETYSILATSYRFIESREKRTFFLLCCLCALGSSIKINELMRYGIGLDLFQNVNKLSEAMDQANKWADELVSSSMLLKTDSPGDFKIHDVVRAFVISFAAQDDGHKFMVDAIPRWMNKKTLAEYTAISMLSRIDYCRLDGMESEKLQILVLRGRLIPNISSSFFAGMKNLEVLDLSDMNLQPILPESMGKLEKLRALYLNGCRLGNIKVIGELVNLSVLCLCYSYMEEFPDDIGELRNLRLLDLTGARCKYQPALASILGRLSELEGLYMFKSFESHINSNEAGGTSDAPCAIEFNKLDYLNALEMHMWCADQLSIDAQFVKNLDNFRICVKYDQLIYSDPDTPQLQSFHGILHIIEIDAGEIVGKKTYKALLQKADWLGLNKCRNINHLFTELDSERLQDLRYLEVDDCEDVTFIINLKGKNELLVFPRLHSLKLKTLPKLKRVCNEEAPPEIFSNLHHLSIYHLENLQYVLPFACVPRTLTKIEVSWCHTMKFIFIENVTDDGRPAVKEETNFIELPFLKSLDLCDLDHLISLLGSENLSCSDDTTLRHQIFFNPRILFSFLEQFSLVSCRRIAKLWDKELGISVFQNLKILKIIHCDNLSNIGPLSVFSTLIQLESLTIVNCKSLHDVITTEGTEELEIHDQVVIFPQLKDLIIAESSKLKSFYGGKCKLKFPNLKKLHLDNLDCFNKFAGSENSSVLFHEEMDFPSLEELGVSCVSDEIMGLWDWHLDGSSTPLPNPVPMLRKLTLGRTKGLRLIPSVIYENLSSLMLMNFNSEVLLSSGEEGSVWTCSQLPKLKDLFVEGSNSLKNLLGKEVFNSAAALTFCEQLKDLGLYKLPRLKMFPCHLFKSLSSFRLIGLSWEHVFSADTLNRLQESLPQLEALVISDCKNMRVVIQGDGEGDADLVFKFSRLKTIILSYTSVISFSSSANATLCLPALERIQIEECEMIRHFWSGPFIAPELKEVGLGYCSNMQSFLAGNPNHTAELVSLSDVRLSDCSAMLSFSSVLLKALSLWQVHVYNCPQMLWFLPNNPNIDGALILPSLASVFIQRCPRMQSFSTGSLYTPAIYYVDFQKCHPKLLQTINCYKTLVMIGEFSLSGRSWSVARQQRSDEAMEVVDEASTPF